MAEYANLAEAAHKAARGKRHRSDVQAFFSRFDENINRLSKDILSRRVPDGTLRRFRIFDPKERIIHAACFNDRVLHHALMNFAGPVLDRSLVASSFACRPGKGIHSAVAYVQLRYMDDIVMWCLNKESAKSMLLSVSDYARQKRLVPVKPASVQINRSEHGITFCGFRILPGTIRMGVRRRKRYALLRRRWEKLYKNGLIDGCKLQQAYAAVHAMTLHADSRQWRRNHLCRFSFLDV